MDGRGGNRRDGKFLPEEKPGVGQDTQRNRKPPEEAAALVLEDLCMQGDRRTLVNRGIQETMKLGQNKDWIRRGSGKGRLGLQQGVFWELQLDR